MGDHARYVFRASRDAHKSITRLYDFVHPTAISLWNLRWQVQGYLASVPAADSKMLDARFASGSGIGSGSLRRAVAEITWDEQLESFASFILVNTIAAFEDYLASLIEISSLSDGQKRSVEKKLQFPSASSNKGLTGARSVLGTSSLLNGCITWDKRIAARIDETSIEQLLVCYRYFKELRNSFAHNGGRISQRQMDAQAALSNSIVNGKIGKVNAPDFYSAPSVGDPAKVSYRGVIGFTEVVLHILATYDSILSKTPLVEVELKSALRPDKGTWPTDERGKARRFIKIFDPNKFPKFSPTPAMVSFLKSEGAMPQSVSL